MGDKTKYFVTEMCTCVKKKRHSTIKITAMKSLITWSYQCPILKVRRNLSETGKIRSYREENIHAELEKFGDDPVLYKFRAENNINSKTRNLHRNLLVTCDQLLDNFNWNILEERNISESTLTSNEQNSIKKLPNEGETTLRWKSQMKMKLVVVVKRAVKKN